MQRLQCFSFIIATIAFSGCGSSYEVEGGFISDKNHCFPDYASIPVPTLTDPVAQALSVAPADSPIYGQSFAVDKTHWSYGLQLRLIFATSTPDIRVQVYRSGADGLGPFGDVTSTMPDGSVGTYVMTAELDIDAVEAAEGWMDFPFAVPQELSAAHTYWALVTPRISGIAWTLTQGTNFSRYESEWIVVSDKQATVRSVGCEEL